MADPMPPQIDDQITIGGLPGAPMAGTPATPGQQVDVRAPATTEYVAGRQLNWYATYPQALPFALDDIAVSFGQDIYRRMLLDAQVRSVVNIVKASILEDGPHIQPAIDDKEGDGYTQAVDLAERVEKMLSEINLDVVLWEMLDAIAVGNRIAEQVYTLDSTVTGKQEYCLSQLAVKPMESVAFVIDVYLNVLGILARIPGQPFGVQQGMILTSLDIVPNFLPRSKFAILTFRPHNNDPRGTSILRPAFDPWNQKAQIKKEYLKYLSQFAVPSLVGFTPEEAQDYQLTNPDGSLQLDTYGNPLMQTPEQAMLTALEAFRNGTATVLPFGSKVDALQVSGSGEAFQAAFEYFDRQIAKAVLHQTLATEEGLHQTRASSGTHKDILDTMIRQAKRPVERMLERDVIRTWATLNGLDAQLDLLPKVSLGTTETEDLPTMWTAAGQLWKAGFMHKSQLAEMDDMLGLPERTPAGEITVPVNEMIRADDNAIGGPSDDDPDPAVGKPKPAQQPQQGQKTTATATKPAKP